MLGTFISYNKKENDNYNLMLKLQKFKTILDIGTVAVLHYLEGV